MKRLMGLTVVLCLLVGLVLGGTCAAGSLAAPKTTEITVWAFSWTATTLDKIKSMFESRYPGVKVKVELQGWVEMQALALAAIASGKGVPDVCTFSSAWVGPMMTGRALAPLQRFIDDEFRAKFIEGAIEIYTYKGSQFGIPLDIDLAPIIYRKDIIDPALAELGMKEFPKDWDSFVKLLKKVSKPGRYGILVGDNTYYLQAAFLYQRGGRLFNDDYTKAYFNSPEMVDALADVNYLHKNNLALLWPDAQGDVMPALKSGQALMYIQGPWYRGPMKQNMPELAGKWAFAPMPIKKPGAPTTALTGLCLAIPFNAPHVEQAVEFVKYFTGDEDAQRAYFADVGSPSPLKALLGDPMYRVVDPYFGVSIYPPLLESMKKAAALEIYPKEEMNQLIRNAMDEVFYQGADPKAALDKAQRQVDAMLAGK